MMAGNNEMRVVEELMGAKKCHICGELARVISVKDVYFCDHCGCHLTWCGGCNQRFAKIGFMLCKECDDEVARRINFRMKYD